MKLSKHLKTLALASASLVLVSTLNHEDVNAQEDGSLVIGLSSDISSLDPHRSNDVYSSQVRSQIYERLIGHDLDMNLVPMLATEWEQVDDVTWNFKLEEGVMFHEGSELTSEDVQATFERVKDEAVAADVAFLFEMIDEVEIIDDYEFNIITEYPFAPLLNHLSHVTGGIMSKELLDADYQYAIDNAGLDITVEEYYELREEGGDEYQEIVDEIGIDLNTVTNESPDGTGPLKFVSRAPGDNVVLERNEDYRVEDLAFEEVTFTVNTESGSRMAELQTGTAHVLHALSPSSVTQVETTDGMELLSVDGLGLSYMTYDIRKEPFDDPKVRQAIAYAVDRESIATHIYEDNASPAISPLAPPVWGHNPDVDTIQYDPEYAAELLSETDVADGFTTSLWVTDNQQVVEMATLIQENLAEIGIEVNIELMDFGTLWQRTGDGEHEMMIVGWTTSTADADYGTYSLLHTDNQGAAGNRTFISDPELDDLLERGRGESDEDLRYEIYTEAQNYLVEIAPMTNIIHAKSIIAYNSDFVTGVELFPSGYINLMNIEFVE
ncbi:ABC transporter substrate-binding protein [Aliicoccus persicus]|uniref:Peptide/nickel transport system substrate-binding protein n=1 Tax=Aliicoccus persicus TaxID=930138 RepID=A0A662Z337_9STAP|nr:ABC transporter substrate-binding protein [Aliicoccus persicus]SEV82948.1 peptide/nickel transport system substrate-binding protein [Aliicoccus persicus]